MDENKKSNLYIKPFLFAFFMFIGYCAYLFLRRGYIDLYIANKAIAGVSFTLLCVVFVLGTITRLFSLFDKYLMYRKELGIVSFGYALAHSFISFFMLPQHFPLSRFMSFPPSFIFGLSGLIVLIILAIYSSQQIIEKLDRKKWWKLQNWGLRIAFVFVLLHVIPMKWNGWTGWFSGTGGANLAIPQLPPLSILVSLFGIYVLIVRVVEHVFTQKLKLVVHVTTIVYCAFLFVLFGWGIVKIEKKPIDWFTCTSIPNSHVLEKFPGECVTPWGEHVTQKINE